jgi:hypothetical protein
MTLHSRPSQECVRKSLKAKQLDYLLDDPKSAPGTAAAAAAPKKQA